MKIRTAAAAFALAVLCWIPLPAASPLMPIDEIKPGMVGVGRTVFEGTELQDFKVHILGVLRNVQGPQPRPDPRAARRRTAGEDRRRRRA